MPKILSYGSSSPKESDRNLPKKIWESFQSIDKFGKFFILTALLIIVATPFVVNNLLETRQRAETKENFIPAQPTSFISNELLVKVKKDSRTKVKEGNPKDTGIPSVDNINKKFEATKFQKLVKPGKKSDKNAEIFAWYKIVLPGKAELIKGRVNKEDGSIESEDDDSAHILKLLMEDLKKDSNIQDVEVNYQVWTSRVPNDPYYPSIGSWGQTYQDLYGMHKINGAAAWESTTGSSSVIVADVDTGVDRNHEDLAGNMWVNTSETPNNSVDDDGNGYVDDYYGWDFANNDNDPIDDNGHGTHTAGTVGAVGNNSKGVVGVNWTTKIMALKFLTSAGSGSFDAALNAWIYAADMGAKVTSNSWGCECGRYSPADDGAAYVHSQGVVTVVAAGNASKNALDTTPADADLAITVAASEYNDQKAIFSNYGEKIDVAAPGVAILSLKATSGSMCVGSRVVGTKYCYVSGTSMATPHVAGLAALLLSKDPSLNPEELRQLIRSGADDLGVVGKDNDFGFGRINAGTSVSSTSSKPLTPVITGPVSGYSITGLSNLDIFGSVGGPNFTSFKLEVGNGRSPSSWQTVSSGTSQPSANQKLGTLNLASLGGDGLYTVRLTATNSQGKTFQFQVFDLVLDNFKTQLTSPIFLSVQDTAVKIIGSAFSNGGKQLKGYTLEWGEGNSPTTWSNSGVTLVNGGLQAVNNGSLAIWNNSSLKTLTTTYSLRLKVESVDGFSDVFTTNVTLDPDLAPNWPVTLYSSDSLRCCKTFSIFADLDGDGMDEIITTANDLVFAHKKDGSLVSGFPRQLVPPSTSGALDAISQVKFPLNVADLDGDGKKELIIGASDTVYYSTFKASYPRIYILRSDGSAYPGWPKPSFLYPNSNSGNSSDPTPLVTDMNNDGSKDLVYIDPKFKLIHAYKLDGTEITGFPVSLSLADDICKDFVQSVYHYPGFAADLDGDGKVEIGYPCKSKLYLFDNTGRMISGWPVTPANINGAVANFVGNPAVGDINGDGKLEIFATAYANTGNCAQGTPCNNFLYALSKSGQTLSGWPKQTAGTGPDSPLVLDFNADGKDEVLTGPSKIALFDESGNLWSNLPNHIKFNGGGLAADIEGDGKLEIFNGSSNSFNIINEDNIKNTSLNPIWSRSYNTVPNALGIYPHPEFSGRSFAKDIDKDGKIEFVQPANIALGVVSEKIFGYRQLWMWKIPPGGNAKYGLAMNRADFSRTGRLLISSAGTISPTPTSVISPTQVPSPSLIPTPTFVPITQPVGLDKTPPTVSITAPVNGAIVARNFPILIQANATDNVAVAKVEFLVNGAVVCTDTTSAYSCNWKTPGKPNANYTISAKAYDTSGNTANVSVSVKTTK